MSIAFRLSIALLAIVVPSMLFASPGDPGPQTTIHIIPQPVSVTEKSGHFTLTASTTIVTEGDSLAQTAAWLAGKLQVQQGKGGKQRIILSLNADKNIHRDGYTLQVTPGAIRISANNAAGVFYGVQSLLQLVPAGATAAAGAEIPCAEITDYPRFGWRGLIHDGTRHLFAKEERQPPTVVPAGDKFPRLPLHLSYDLGSRIEIKSMPA